MLPPSSVLADILPPDDLLLSPTGAIGARRIGSNQVRDLQSRVHALRLADDVLSGRDLVRPALRELTGAVRLIRESSYSEVTGSAMLRQIGELAQIAGWIAADAGRLADAERVYRLGLSAAHQAQDMVLAGNVQGSLGYLFSNTGREAQGLVQAEAALHGALDAGAPPKARALYWDRVAWAHTKAGPTHGQAALRALGRAEAALDEDGTGTQAPAYVYWMSRAEAEVMEARIFTELRKPLRAVPKLTGVLAQYDVTHARELALYTSWKAVALADANEPEEAARTARRVIELTASISSDRAERRVAVVLDRLSHYSSVPEVAALLAEYARG